MTKATTDVSIVNYGVGNLGSVCNMYRRLGVDFELVDTPEGIARANRILLPGVGAFDRGREGLTQSSMDEAIVQKAEAGTPLLGICLGMQLMTRRSEEGRLAGLGLVPAECHRLTPDMPNLRVPHMGWNWLSVVQSHPLLTGLPDPAKFYFAHSYAATCDEESLIATSQYGGTVTAMIGRDNVCGAQFHPEKSHHFGLAFLEGFSVWSP